MITFKLFLSLFVVVIFAKVIFVCGKSNTLDDLESLNCTRRGRENSIGRMIGGSRARITKWPWQVLISLYHPNVWETYFNGQGGGSLINHEWVLTAAHIFDNINKIRNWEHGIVLTFGVHRLPHSNHRFSSQVQVFKAENIILHSDYSSTTYDYDVALIKVGQGLKEREGYWVETKYTGWVSYTRKVQPVRLPCMERSCTRKHLKLIGLLRNNHTEEISCSIEGDWLLEKNKEDNKSAFTVVTGFGITTTPRHGFQQKMSKVLKKGQIRLYSDARCNRTADEIINAFPNKHLAKFTNRMICGIGGDSHNAIDACLGDSGGPLVRKVEDSQTERCCWVQIGIVSWGFGCGQNYEMNGTVKQRLGYYTNVIALLPWIMEHGAEGTLCAVPSSFQFGTVISSQNRVAFNQSIFYACNKGFVMVDVPSNILVSKCQKNGTWTKEIPVCVVNRCDPNPCHGRGTCINNNQHFICKCDEGYEGDDCTIKKIKCLGIRVARSNSRITSRNTKGFYEYGDKITFMCDRGYRLFGQEKSICQSNGHWSATSPVCRKIRCFGIPVARSNGRITSRNTKGFHEYGDKIAFMCDRGYDLFGQKKSICQSNGHWSAASPVCRKIRCLGIPVAPINGKIISRNTKGFHEYGDKITFMCDRGYDLFGQKKSICKNNGHWSAASPVCRRIRCLGNRVAPSNGRIISRNTTGFHEYGDKIAFMCDRNYRLFGQNMIICQSNGHWSAASPVCRKIRCLDILVAPSNGRIISRNTKGFHEYGDKITFMCDRGYDLFGQKKSICQSNGHWSAASPVCRSSSDCDGTVDDDNCGEVSQSSVSEVESCNNTVGMKDNRVRDNDITASSSSDSHHLPQYARLDLQAAPGIHYSCWVPNYPHRVGEWIQVDLKVRTTVVAIITQGFSGTTYGITRFKISYGTSFNQLQIIRNNNGTDVIFHAEPDSFDNDYDDYIYGYDDAKTRNNFPQPVSARYIRLIVQAWRGHPFLRMEYITC